MLDVIWAVLQVLWITIKCFLIELCLIFIPSRKKSIEGRVVLVTGGANGFGREICFRLAREKCKVAVADLDETNGEETAKKICLSGSEAKFFSCDVSNYKSIESLKERIEQSLGPVDVVINNAALLFADPIEYASPEFLNKYVSVNFMSLFYTTKVFLPSMKIRGFGHIVAVSSMSGLVPMPYEHAYTAIKFGMRGFMEAMRIDLYMSGFSDYVKTTTVFPGFMNTRPDLKKVHAHKFRGPPFIKRLLSVRPRDAADALVAGMLRNKRRVITPTAFATVYKMRTTDRAQLEQIRLFFNPEVNDPNRPQGREIV